jgi:hypothetical protein
VQLQISEVNHFGNGESRYIASETASAPDFHLFALLPSKDAEAVVLDFVQPPRSGWRAGGERRFTRADEADRRFLRQRGAGARQGVTRFNGRRRRGMVGWVTDLRGRSLRRARIAGRPAAGWMIRSPERSGRAGKVRYRSMGGETMADSGAKRKAP